MQNQITGSATGANPAPAPAAPAAPHVGSVFSIPGEILALVLILAEGGTAPFHAQKSFFGATLAVDGTVTEKPGAHVDTALTDLEHVLYAVGQALAVGKGAMTFVIGARGLAFLVTLAVTRKH